MAIFIAIVKRDRDVGYTAWFPDFPSCAVSAPTVDHVIARAREALSLHIERLLEANNGVPLDPEAVEFLNRTAARTRVVAAFDDHASWRIEPTSKGVDYALGRLLAGVFAAMSDGSWNRMKACANPECRWAFYDKSKNHSARWCEMASCGNRMKARRFRERAREAHER